MSLPVRIQLSRAKGWRMPAGAVKVDRSTRFGNPFRATHLYCAFQHKGLPAALVPFRSAPSLELALDLFTAYLHGQLAINPGFLDPLKGKDLACWCAPGAPCHADVLLRIANEAGDWSRLKMPAGVV